MLVEEYNLEKADSVTSSQEELARIKAEEDKIKKDAKKKKRGLNDIDEAGKKEEDAINDYFSEFKPHSQPDGEKRSKLGKTEGN